MSLSPVRLRDGWLQPNRLSGGRIGGGGQSPRDAILATASPATLSYVQAVEAADGNIQLENAVLAAMVEFANYRIPLGGACCLMAGARTLAGALVPMVGEAPDPVNFVTGDYNRSTGLKGDGIGKYLDSNRNNNVDPQNSKHLGVYVSAANSIQRLYIGASFLTTGVGCSNIGVWSASSGPYVFTRANGVISSTQLNSGNNTTGFIGTSRPSSVTLVARAVGANSSGQSASQAPYDASIAVFAEPGPGYVADGRLSMYSIGPAVDLAAMDTAITTCMSALAAAGI